MYQIVRKGIEELLSLLGHSNLKRCLKVGNNIFASRRFSFSLHTFRDRKKIFKKFPIATLSKILKHLIFRKPNSN